MSNALATTNTKPLIARVAERFGVDPDKMKATMKATCFRQKPGKDGGVPKEVTDEQFMALCAVSDAYGLNPFVKEIYAFPDGGGIVPMVSVDGWIRIINDHPQFDGFEFVSGPIIEKGNFAGLPEWVDCIIHRKDRSRPTVIREYMEECFNERSPVWQKSPRRFLRHRALIQCGRVAFGFGGDMGVAGDETYVDVTPPLALAEPPKPTKAADRAAALASKPVEVIEAKVEPEPAPVEVAPVRQPTEKEARIALYAEAKRHVAAGADEPFIRAFLAESTLVSAKGINDACAELFPKSRPAPADDEP